MVERGRLSVPNVRFSFDFSHQGRMMKAVFPFYAPKQSPCLRGPSRTYGLREATSAELFSFLDAVVEDNSDFVHRDANWIMKRHNFRSSTALVYDDANQRLSCVDDPPFDAYGSINLDLIMARLSAGAGIRSVPFSQLKNMELGSAAVSGSPFVRCLVGDENAGVVARVAAAHRIGGVQLSAPRKDGPYQLIIPDIYSLNDTLHIGCAGSTRDSYSLGIFE